MKRKGASADDWLRLLDLRFACSKSGEAWKQTQGKPSVGERGALDASGCQERVLYLSVILLERQGVALAIDGEIDFITRAFWEIHIVMRHSLCYSYPRSRAIIPSRDKNSMDRVSCMHDPFRYPPIRCCLQC